MPFTGSATEVIRDIQSYRALGVTHFVFDPVPADLKGRLILMERFAETVFPQFESPRGRASGDGSAARQGSRRTGRGRERTRARG